MMGYVCLVLPIVLWCAELRWLVTTLPLLLTWLPQHVMYYVLLLLYSFRPRLHP
jgi:hypothetical protein